MFHPISGLTICNNNITQSLCEPSSHQQHFLPGHLIHLFLSSEINFLEIGDSLQTPPGREWDQKCTEVMALLSVFLTDLIYPRVGHAFRMFSSMISGLHCCNKSVISVWPFKIRGGLAHHNGSPESWLELATINREDFTITEKAPIRAFSWLKEPTSASTFKTLLRLLDHKGQADWLA